MKYIKPSFILFTLIVLTFSACQFSKKVYNQTSDAVSNVNLFTAEDDIKLGAEFNKEIQGNPKEYPILNKSQNREVYAYLEKLKKVILNSGELKYRSEFVWDLTIIDDDKTLNAFATPGGYIYVYTGLIKFLDSEDQLLGVLGHEMAHADRRHSTRQLTKTYGLSMLLNVVLGDRDAIEQVMGGLAGLSFSRSHESEADEYSVKYLCKTSYNSAGSAGFFKKMLDQPSPPKFLSTHPSPASRVKDIQDEAVKNNCKGTKTNKTEYDRIKAKI